VSHALISGYAALAVVLSAWWQLRRSAYLLPYLRWGPSSFFFNPGPSGFARVMVIITLQVPLAICRLRSPARPPARGPEDRGQPTVPIPMPPPVADPPTCPLPVIAARLPKGAA
jgi:hypothetical protein